MHAKEKYSRRTFKLGPASYITKDSPRAELANAKDKVIKGSRYVSAALAEKLIVDLEMSTGW